MGFSVYLFLLLVCLLLFLELLWGLDWLHLRPSREEAKRRTLHRLLKPGTPDDCPACRLASTAAFGGGPAPVRPIGVKLSHGQGAPEADGRYSSASDAWEWNTPP